MTKVKEQAIEFIKTIPDDKIIYIMNMFKDVKGIWDDNEQENKQAQQFLLEDIKGLRGIVRSDIDENFELMKARDEKYASLG